MIKEYIDQNYDMHVFYSRMYCSTSGLPERFFLHLVIIIIMYAAFSVSVTKQAVSVVLLW